MFLATAGNDGAARVWEVETGLAVAVMRGHTESVTTVAFSPDGTSLLTDSFDRSARTWLANAGAAVIQLPRQAAPITDIDVSLDRKLVGTAAADGTTRVWQISAGTLLTVLHSRKGDANRIVFGPDSTSVLIAGDDGMARILDAKGATLRLELSGHSGSPRLLKVSRDRKLVLTTGQDGTASAWDWTTGKLLSTVSGLGTLHSTDLTEDGRHAMALSDDKTVRVWKTATGDLLSTFKPAFIEKALDAAFVNGGPTAMVVGRLGISGSSEWFDANSGKSLGLPRTCCYLGLLNVAFGQASRRLALVGVDEVTVVDLLEDRSIALDDPGLVAKAAFSPNEECVLTVPAGGRIRLWEAKSGRRMAEFSIKASSSSLTAFSDDSRMVMVSTGGTAQIFSSDACGSLDDMMNVARSRIVRPLNSDERRRFLHEGSEPTQR
jgi:WD40 repeat protein